MDNEYFASAPEEDIGKELIQRVENYYSFIDGNGYIKLWKDVYHTYYNGFFSKGEVLNYGQQGEKRKMVVNDFSSIIQHIKVLTTDQRPVFEPKAVNSDYKSAAQVNLARVLLDYYMRQENLECVIDTCLDYSLQAGEGYMFLEWDSTVGKVVGMVEQEMEEEDENEEDDEEDEGIERMEKREGNIKAYAIHPIDVARDWNKDTSDNNDWYIVRRRVNKYDLAAKYPRFEEDIVGNDMTSTNVTMRSLDEYDFKRYGESDQIYMFTFRHDKSPALPNGRQVEFLSDGTVIFDGDLPYSDISIYKLFPHKRSGTNFGYTVAFDMLPLQKALDMLDSTIVTNQNAFGVQNIVCQKGSGIQTTALTEGLNKIEYSGDKPPEALKLLATAAEIFNYKEQLVQRMETISGVNSVSRGNPEASLRSGSALALVQSMAIQFNSGLQHSYAQMLERLGSGVVKMLQDYANSPRVALIAGISRKSYLKEFKGEDLDMIDRVVVDMGNPMSKTLAGRLQIADNLVERGLVDNPDQYLQVMETGRIDPLLEGKTSEIMNIRGENEKLTTGEGVSAIYTDNHWLHIKEHKNVLSSPDSRQVQEVVVSTLTHINEHINLLRTTDPGILMILGQQPIPSPMNSMTGGMESPMPPMQPEKDTPQQGQIGTPPPGGPEGAPSGAGGNGIGGADMPKMPKNALSGEEFNTNTGGL
jgi:hypothetical protein